MPKDSINVYFTITDNGSKVLASITDKTKALDKETQRLAQTNQALKKANEPLLKSQVELEKQLSLAAREAKEAEKAYKKLGDTASDETWTKAKEKQQALHKALAETKGMIQENERAYKSNLDTIRKGSDGSATKGISNIAWGLASSGVGSQLASSLGGWAEAHLTSEIGTPEASLLSGIVSGGISGAAAGMALGWHGALGGAALGALSGLISGKTQIFQAEDDAFKDYYNGLYEDVNAATAQSVAGGSTLAAGRETDRLSFATLLGDEERAEDFLGGLVDMANHTPFLYDDLTAMSKTLATYGFKDRLGEGEEGYGILDTLQKVGDAGAALGMTTSDMTSVATALGRMLSSDKASLEYLNILNDRGIGAVGYLAEARGKSVGETYTDISKGNITGGEAVEAILAAMERDFAGSMEDQSKTFAGLSSTLEGLRQEVDNAAGEGYNDLRGGGIADEIASLDGPLGEALKKAAAVSGENQAYLDNLKEQYQREALEAVLLGYAPSEQFSAEDQEKLQAMADAYADAAQRYEAGSQEAGLEMESLKEQAEALASAAYDSSEFVKQANDAQLEQIAAIRENTKSLDGWRAAYDRQQEQSKGRGLGITGAAGGTAALQNGELDPARLREAGRAALFDHAAGKGYAEGLAYVPYDGFPAVLHQGERVLTASEARAQDAGGVQVSIGSITVGGGLGGVSTWDIAMEIAQELERAAVAAAPR